jgi:hypothetical protein
MVTGSFLKTSASVTNESCFGAKDGNAEIIVTGGKSPYIFSWNQNLGSNSGINNLTAGIYSCIVSDANNCQSNHTVTITSPAKIEKPTGNELQSFEIAQPKVLDLVANPAIGSQLLWYETESNAINGLLPLSVDAELENNKSYYAVSAIGNCRSEVLAVTASIITGAFGGEVNSIVDFFPNPVKDYVNFNGLGSDVRAIRIYDFSGTEIKEFNLENSKDSFDVSDLKSGIYLLKLENGDSVLEQKLIKE